MLIYFSFFSLPIFAILSTSTANYILGRAPIITAPSQPTFDHSIDFSAITATTNVIATGDTLVLDYHFRDEDADSDDTLSTIEWFCSRPSGSKLIFSSGITNTYAPSGNAGSSSFILPADSIGCTIGIRIIETTRWGVPLQGETIEVNNIASNHTGGTSTPPFPVFPGSNVLTGIYLASDIAFSSNLLFSAQHLNVNESYVFVAWEDKDGNGDYDPVIDKKLNHLLTVQNWLYTDSSILLPGNPSATPPIFSGQTGESFIVPDNLAASTQTGFIMPHGAQGYHLKVQFK